MTAALALLVAALVIRSATPNRHVRGRLLASSIVFGAAALIGALRYGTLSAEFYARLVTVQPLLIAFGVINASVALAVNPWRADRVPDRFPTIVQDTIVILLFAVAAALVLEERIFTTTAVGAVVIGFALQDTLGNLFAGLAIQIEKPFRVGHWVKVAGTDGLVSEITWRATKLKTKTGNFVIVPNSALSKENIVNYSEPTPDTCVEVDVGASYDTPPNQVKAVILAAIRHEPLVSDAREPEVLLVDFAASAITYRVRVWTRDFGADERLRDRIRTAVYYAFKRTHIEIPYPIQVELHRDVAIAGADPAAAAATLAEVDIFHALSAEQRLQLAHAARRSLYAAGDAIVRQGEPGSSMFVVVSGEAVVRLDPSGQEVARIGPGGFFGEMSLLTGAPRSATVVTVADSELLEMTAEAFRAFVLENPQCVDRIAAAAAARTAELEAHRAAATTAAAGDARSSLLDRVRRFLRLTTA